MSPWEICQREAEGICQSVASLPVFELRLLPDLATPDPDWDIIAVRTTGQEILFSSESLDKAALVLALVLDRCLSHIRVCGRDGVSRAAPSLPELLAIGLSDLDTETGDCIFSTMEEVLSHTISHHGRTLLLGRITLTQEGPA